MLGEQWAHQGGNSKWTSWACLRRKYVSTRLDRMKFIQVIIKCTTTTNRNKINITVIYPFPANENFYGAIFSPFLGVKKQKNITSLTMEKVKGAM